MFRVMVADDNPYVLDELTQSIDWENYDFELIGAYPNGQALLTAALETPPDIVFTDISMPVMDGISMSSHLLQTNDRVKIVFFSEHSEFEYAKKALSLRIYDYLVKPIQPAQIEDLLRKLLLILQKEQLSLFEKNRSQTQKEYYQRAALSHFISSLLYHPVAESQIRYELEQLGLTPSADLRCYIVVYSSSGSVADLKQPFSEEYFHSMLSASFVTSQTIPIRSNHSNSTEGAFLLLTSDRQMSVSNTLSKVCIDAEAQMGHSLIMGYSSPSMRFSDIATLYEQAQIALKCITSSDCSIPVASFNATHVEVEDSDKSTNHSHSNYVPAMQAFIHTNYMNPITTSDVGQSVYLSSGYANLCFTKECGMTIFNYISWYRIEKAKILLRNTDEQVTRIAELVGYSGKTSFYLAFKRSTGISPTEYRLQR